MRGRWVVALLGLAAGCPDRDSAPPQAPAASAGVVAAGLPVVASDPPVVETPAQVAERVAHAVIIVDGHVDLPWRLEKEAERGVHSDPSRRTDDGDFDAERAAIGGLDAPFMSIFVPTRYEKKGAPEVADRLIDRVEALATAAPQVFAMARSPSDVRRNFAAGLISLPLGMENGAPIAGKLANVQHFYERGIRYITLAHAEDNHLADSSYSQRHTHHGLSAFGKKVVQEMNRLGIMIDVSHLSDEAFWDVLDLSKVPVIASHSSCRAFTPGFERNMSDAMITALAERGGVIQINFGSGFLDNDLRAAIATFDEQLHAELKHAGVSEDDPQASVVVAAFEEEHSRPRASVELVADHIEHVIELCGVDHVGLGSDFEGVGDSLPEGLRDVSQYPRLLEVLIARGHSAAELEKIAGANVLRVWDAAGAHAAAEAGGAANPGPRAPAN